MERLIIITISILYSSLALALSAYQIDLILFSHPNLKTESTTNTPILPIDQDAISLKMDAQSSSKSYRLLPPSFSSLRDEYYLLTRKSPYKVLGHYSWKQPARNQARVALPLIEHQGWQMQGVLKIAQSNYYIFKAELQVSPPNNPQSSFTILQKHRLKPEVVYYIDHAQIGMLIKIHSVA